jgi:hypothetical protein
MEAIKSNYTRPESEAAIVEWLVSGQDAGRLQATFPDIGSAWFCGAGSRLIFEASRALAAEGQNVNGLTLSERLASTGKLKEAGGPAALAPGKNSTWGIAQSAAASLRDAYQRRRVAETLKDAEGRPARDVMELLKPLAEAEGQKPDGLFEAFSAGAIPFTKLKEVGIPPRRKIVGDWFCEADLSFVFAPRGLGKTWFSLGLASAIVGKATFGPWPVHDHAPVLYLDGEMPLESIEQRIAGMGADDDLSVLSHEGLFHRTGKVLNLTDPEAQDAITRLCLRDGIKVLFLDNISCLFNGLKENGADEWEMVLPWLLTLRRHRVAVIIVAHAGRNGQMRGTSRREDAAFSVLKLEEAQDAGTLKEGAKFILRFTKDRNSRTEQPAMEWTFTTGDDGKVSISTKEADGLAVMIEWVRDGLTGAREIAAEMGMSPGAVSKMAKRAIEAGRLRKEGRGYALA